VSDVEVRPLSRLPDHASCGGRSSVGALRPRARPVGPAASGTPVGLVLRANVELRVPSGPALGVLSAHSHRDTGRAGAPTWFRTLGPAWPVSRGSALLPERGRDTSDGVAPGDRSGAPAAQVRRAIGRFRGEVRAAHGPSDGVAPGDRSGAPAAPVRRRIRRVAGTRRNRHPSYHAAVTTVLRLLGEHWVELSLLIGLICAIVAFALLRWATRDQTDPDHWRSHR
jgi:hypothetical protein